MANPLPDRPGYRYAGTIGNGSDSDGGNSASDMVRDGGWGMGPLFPDHNDGEPSAVTREFLNTILYDLRGGKKSSYNLRYDAENRDMHWMRTDGYGDDENPPPLPYIPNYSVPGQTYEKDREFSATTLKDLPPYLTTNPKILEKIARTESLYNQSDIMRNYPNLINGKSAYDLVKRSTHVILPILPLGVPTDLPEWKQAAGKAVPGFDEYLYTSTFEEHHCDPHESTIQVDRPSIGVTSVNNGQNMEGYREIYNKYCKLYNSSALHFLEKRRELLLKRSNGEAFEKKKVNWRNDAPLLRRTIKADNSIWVGKYKITEGIRTSAYSKQLVPNKSIREFLKEFMAGYQEYLRNNAMPNDFSALGAVQMGTLPITWENLAKKPRHLLAYFGFDDDNEYNGTYPSFESVTYSSELKSISNNFKPYTLDPNLSAYAQLKKYTSATPQSKPNMALWRNMEFKWASPKTLVRPTMTEFGVFDLPLFWVYGSQVAEMHFKTLKARKFSHFKGILSKGELQRGDIFAYFKVPVYGYLGTPKPIVLPESMAGEEEVNHKAMPHIYGSSGIYTYNFPVGVNFRMNDLHFGARTFGELSFLHRNDDGYDGLPLLYTDTERYGVHPRCNIPVSRNQRDIAICAPLFIDLVASDTTTEHYINALFPKLYFPPADIGSFSLFRLFGNNNRMHIIINVDQVLDMAYPVTTDWQVEGFQNHFALMRVEGENNVITIDIRGDFNILGNAIDPGFFYGLVSNTPNNTLILKYPNGKNVLQAFTFDNSTNARGKSAPVFYPFVQPIFGGYGKDSRLVPW